MVALNYYYYINMHIWWISSFLVQCMVFLNPTCPPYSAPCHRVPYDFNHYCWMNEGFSHFYVCFHRSDTDFPFIWWETLYNMKNAHLFYSNHKIKTHGRLKTRIINAIIEWTAMACSEMVYLVAHYQSTCSAKSWYMHSSFKYIPTKTRKNREKEWAKWRKMSV